MATQIIETRSIEITVQSASDLRKTKLLSRTKAYAVAFIHGHSRSEHRTSVDNENGRNTKWNHAMSFTVHEASLQQDHLLFTVQIWTDSACGAHLMGHVTVPLKTLLKQPPQNGKPGWVSYHYQVLSSSGKPKGTLNLSVRLGNKSRTPVKQHTLLRSHAATLNGNGFYAHEPLGHALIVAGISSNSF